jgi:hypothetical protein
VHLVEGGEEEPLDPPAALAGFGVRPRAGRPPGNRGGGVKRAHPPQLRGVVVQPSARGRVVLCQRPLVRAAHAAAPASARRTRPAGPRGGLRGRKRHGNRASARWAREHGPLHFRILFPVAGRARWSRGEKLFALHIGKGARTRRSSCAQSSGRARRRTRRTWRRRRGASVRWVGGPGPLCLRERGPGQRH